MKRGLISIVLMALVALAGMAQVSRHEVKVGNFSRLALIDNINVNYRCNADSAGLAVLTCTQDIADHIMFSLSSKGQLSIQVVDEYERTGDLPTITVYSSSLENAENAGDSTLRLYGLPPMKEFKVILIDNGKVIARD